MIRMLFSADGAHGILSTDAGIADPPMMKCVDLIVSVFTSQRNTSVLLMVEAIFTGTV